MPKKKTLPYLYQAQTKKKLWILLWGAMVLSVLLELTLHRHSHFAESGLHAIDGAFGFYAGLGLIGTALLIVVAQSLGQFLKAKEDYYE